VCVCVCLHVLVCVFACACVCVCAFVPGFFLTSGLPCGAWELGSGDLSVLLIPLLFLGLLLCVLSLYSLPAVLLRVVVALQVYDHTRECHNLSSSCGPTSAAGHIGLAGSHGGIAELR
jgi:hypothetical protein